MTLFYQDVNKYTRPVLKDKWNEILLQCNFTMPKDVGVGYGELWHPEGVALYFDGMTSQCGAAILHGWRVKGIARLEEVACQVLRALGYSKVMASLTNVQSEVQQHLLSVGWKVVDTFVNKRTNRTISILTKEL